MSAKYILEEREEKERLERIRELQPKFNTATTLDKYFQKAINVIFSGTMNSATLNGLGMHPNIRTINDFYSRLSAYPEQVEKCKNAFLHLHKKKAFKLLEDHKKINSLINAMSMSMFWVRDFDSWKKTSHNIDKQFSSILRHMFAKYPVPLFLDNANIKWFIHLGLGKSVRELEGFPVTMTKRMAHEFMNTPVGYDIHDAIRRAQVISLGGNETLAWYIAASRVGHGAYGQEEFWASVILFFCKAPMFDYSLVPGIIDFLYDQKFTEHQVAQGNGLFRHVIANPNLSMKGRTVEALIRDSEVWHNQIAKTTKHIGTGSSWESTRIGGFELKEGSEEKGTERRYNIVELLRSSELTTEGRTMHNCVSSYSRSCESGRCSIWSLRLTTQFSHEESLATIEVINASKMIVQVRAKSNSKLVGKEKTLVERWANQSGLGISGSAFGGH